MVEARSNRLAACKAQRAGHFRGRQVEPDLVIDRRGTSDDYETDEGHQERNDEQLSDGEPERARPLCAQRLSQLEWLTMIFPVTKSYFQPPGSPTSAVMFKLPRLMSTIARELDIGSFGT